jgi:hypothetical protein
MGETHETENVTSEEAEILAEKVAQTMQNALENNQEAMECNLEEMQNHLSLGQAELKLSFASLQRGQDIMIAMLEEQSKHQGILSQYLMEQRHGKDPPLFGGSHDAGGSRGGNGNHEESIHIGHVGEHGPNDGIPIPSHTASRTTPRSYMPSFLDTQRREANALDSKSLGDEWETTEREYNAMIAGFRRQVSMGEYFYLKMKRRSMERYKGVSELGPRARKMELPSFDGSDHIQVTTWVQKMDAYLQLNPMEESEAIKFATLYLMGKAREWWFYGITTLGHGCTTSYQEFTQRLIDRFDKGDPNRHFRELTQLKQTGSAEAFIEEFQRVSMMVLDMAESRLLMLFIDGLTKPIRGWVKAFKPVTLQDAIKRTRDLVGAANKNRFTPKPPIIPRGRDIRPMDKGKGKLDEATRRDL